MTLRRRTLLRTGAAVVSAGIAGCSVGVGTTLVGLRTASGDTHWTADVGTIDAGPLLRDGTIYVGSDETLSALSPANGSERWAVDLDIGSLPEVGRPRLTRNTVLASVGAYMVALRTADGTERWRFEADADVWATPPIVDGTVVVGAGDSTIYGVSLDDGSERWRYDGEALEMHSAAAADGTVLATSGAGRVVALDHRDGSERWTVETDEPARGRPAVGDGMAFVGTEARRVYALSIADGSQAWSLDTSGDSVNVSTGYPVTRFRRGWVYVVDNDVLYAVESRTGEGWTFDVDGSFGVTARGDGVYVGAGLSSTGPEGESNEFGVVHALDPGDGTERWRANFETAQVEMPPGVGGDAVYAGAEDGTLRSLARADGSERWVHEADDGIGSHRPLVTDEVVVVSTE